MTRLLGLSGSLRRASFNTALLNAMTDHLPEGVTLEVATLHGIPLYDGDLEAAEGIPDAVAELAQAIAAADGLILSTPEYNNGMPGVLKNAVDWLSRGGVAGGKLFAGRKLAIAGASPGGFGTIMAQAHWLPVLRTLGIQLWPAGRLLVSQAHKAFDAEGRLADANIRDQLAPYLAGFAAFVRGRP
ncbi:NADPH-dependent FMN reductase [Zavarzinia compransoris]|uniref:NADPH-dependent FMN reductase n=1 Tax=Zavarzinia compransoris TaxID=1264899 RepID=A0A317E5I9_9PROT|nr:NADPH-dependent FMN reductase [Zavarzinia compransoris]PWR21872.1 NADPH-dependent FMN reductase [Zavarzinia compransoris]TDP45322.1 NAD(P)H-dependent FMN reductase [Zavarzinia compransoris]